MKNIVFHILLLSFLSISLIECFTSEEVKCHVCKATVQEMEDAISAVDPNKVADVSGFRLDADGNSISKTVKLIKSEMFLTELMEKICDKMEDYVKATYKKSKKFMLLKMVINGKMNPDASNVDFVQDGDLNKSLAHYCLEILDDYEEVFLNAFQAEKIDDHLDIKICSEQASYCKDAPVQEDYEFDEFKDEL